MSRGSHLDFAAITDRLQRVLAQVDGDLQLAEQSVATVTLDHGCVASLSPMLGMQQQAVTQASVQRLKTQKRRIAAAMDRVAVGTYGLCCECGDTITAERLQSDPAVLFCTDCQAERQ